MRWQSPLSRARDSLPLELRPTIQALRKALGREVSELWESGQR